MRLPGPSSLLGLRFDPVETIGVARAVEMYGVRNVSCMVAVRWDVMVLGWCSLGRNRV